MFTNDCISSLRTWLDLIIRETYFLKRREHTLIVIICCLVTMSIVLLLKDLDFLVIVTVEIVLVFVNFSLQGKQTLSTYSSRGSFSWICMGASVAFCCHWTFHCCIKLWSFHNILILPGIVSWNHLFCSSF